MAGCGIRSLRWGLEAAKACSSPLEIAVNDADLDRFDDLQANLAALERSGINLQLTHQPAEVVLAQSRVEARRFDLVDLDAFGCPAALIQPALQVLRTEGILVLASTDGRSPTGHDRRAAIRRFGTAARVHPASWEMALRQLLGLVARQAWMLGRGVEPLVSFSDGRTFRLAVRLRHHPAPGEELLLGLLARCEHCGAQQEQSMLNLRGWSSCCCALGDCRWMVHGPLWLGPLQNTGLLTELIGMDDAASGAITQRLLLRLQADCGSPARVWTTAELSRRLGLAGPPPLKALVNSLRSAGQTACCSGVMPGQLRTNADLPVLLQHCSALRAGGI